MGAPQSMKRPEPETSSIGAPSGRHMRRWALLGLAVLILAAAVIPGYINVNRHRARLAATLSAELGRRVTIGGISLRLLPKPGFDISGFAVADDPAFSQEPLLTAGEVNADLRIASLWRGRLEIAKISLKQPSLNLVRDSGAHWNLEALMLRAAQIPSAPTSLSHVESRPRFPYVEAEDGRINFKSGEIKSVYAITEADFSWWLEGDNRWNVQLEAKPIRTDLPISDTGTMRVRARLGRAATLGGTPIEATVTLNDAQLGSLTKLFLGRDVGWRGGVSGDLTAQGRLDSLHLASRLRVSDFRRYDVATASSANWRAECSAVLNYHPGVRSLDAMACNAPLGDGELGLVGMLQVRAGEPQYSITLQARQLSLEPFGLIYRNARQNVAPDLSFQGTANGEITFVRNEDSPHRVVGRGSIAGLKITSSALATPLEAASVVVFSASSGDASNAHERGDAAPSSSIVTEPFTIPQLGTVSGTAAAEGWTLNIALHSTAPALSAMGRTFGTPVAFQATQGTIGGSVVASGKWTGYRRADISGDLKLADVVSGSGRSEVRIHSADLTLAPQVARIEHLRASLAALSTEVNGSVSVTRPCAVPLDCQYQVALEVPHLDAAKFYAVDEHPSGILAMFLRHTASKDWLQQVLPAAERLNVTGTIAIGELRFPGAALHNVVSSLTLHDGVLKLTDGSAAAFGGSIVIHGTTVDLAAGAPPQVQLAGTAQRLNLSMLATALRAGDSSGTLNGAFRITMSGASAEELARSATGNIGFDVANGALAVTSRDFHFRRFTGSLLLHDAKLSLDNAQAITSDGRRWTVTGDLLFSRSADATFTSRNQRMVLQGPLATAAK